MIGILGGSGFYEFLDDGTATSVDSRYGSPSADPVVGTVRGHEVAFIPRHGRRHEHPPHLVPYRANIDTMRILGADRIVAATAAGSLRPEIAPGDFVVPDQIVDRTWAREHTFHDGPDVEHLTFADPYHPTVRQVLVDGMRSTGVTTHDGGTVVVIQGPRFSTRAESRAFVAAGWDLVNMTQMPEASLAAEAGIAYANISVVTDHDSGVEGASPVTHRAVLERFARSSQVLKEGLRSLLPAVADVELP